MIYRRPQVIALTVLITIAAGLLFAPAVSAQESDNPDVEDGVIQDCTTIDESGTYTLDSNIGQDSGNCLDINVSDTETVTIEGNGNTIQGSGQTSSEGDSAGIYVESARNVVLRDATVDGWDVALDLSLYGSGIDVEDSQITNNHAGMVGSFSVTSFDNVVVSGNAIGITGTATGVEITDSQIVENTDGVHVMDGGGPDITNSTVSRNSGTAVRIGHMTTEASITGSTIENNGGPGVQTRGTSSAVAVSDSTVQGNGYELRALNGGSVDANNVEVGSGLVADGSGQYELDANPSDQSTEAVTVSGDAVTVDFTTDSENAELLEQNDGSWEQVETYEGTDGSFEASVSDGTFAANEMAGQTATPSPTATATATPTATSTPTDEPTPTSTNEPTDEPSTQEPSTAADTPTETGSGSQPIVAPQRITTDTPTETPTDAPARETTATDAPAGETTETAAYTDIPAEMDTPVNETATENETSAPATETATTGGDDGEPSGDSGSSWQMYGISMAIILLLATLTASLVSWE